jgi:hypothetical protein
MTRVKKLILARALHKGMQNIFIGFAARASDFLSICLNLPAKGALNLFDGAALNWLVHDHFPCMEECERVGRRACMFVCQPAGIRNVLDIAVHTIHMANGYRTTSQAPGGKKSCDAVFLSNKSIRGMARHQKEWRGSFIFIIAAAAAPSGERKRKCTVLSRIHMLRPKSKRSRPR